MVLRWKLKNRCEEIFVIDLFKAFDYIESSHKPDIFSPKKNILFHAFETCSKLPSNISTRE